METRDMMQHDLETMIQAGESYQIATELTITARTIRNTIDLLVSKGWVESSGNTKGRTYGLTETGQKWVGKRV